MSSLHGPAEERARGAPLAWVALAFLSALGLATAALLAARHGVDAPRGASMASGVPHASCDGSSIGADARCGAADSPCCGAAEVPDGRYRRAYDGVMCTDGGFQADVSAFTLDRFEVTVGRFRRFLDSAAGTREHPPAEGAGAHPAIAGSGWRASWSAGLAVDRAMLEQGLGCGPAATWTALAAETDTRPINCVTWYEAFAFCAWDGGRLPTEAEWNLAAAGGSEERERPWTVDRPSSIERAHAVFTEARPFPVGSCSPRGDGRWGHADLVGNVWEWTLDANETGALLPREGASPCATAGLPLPCDDCVGVGAEGAARVLRGGGFGMPSAGMRVAIRRADDPAERQQVFGIRCARSVEGSTAAPDDAAPWPADDAGRAAAAALGDAAPVLRGFATPALDVEHAATLSLADLASDPSIVHADGAPGHVLLIRTCTWSADSVDLVSTLHARRAALAARGVAIVIVLAEGQRRGQAADLIDVASFARDHAVSLPIAADEAGASACDGAVLFGGADLGVVATGTSADALAGVATFASVLGGADLP